MSHLEVAAFLLAIVIAVIAATRPAPPRRRTRSQPPPDRKPDPRRSQSDRLSIHRSIATPAADQIHRNRWDRADLATGVGRDDVRSDVALALWPAPKHALR